VTACPRCGFDSAAAVTAEWRFFIPVLPPTQNYLKGMNRWAYKKLRDEFSQWVQAKASGIPRATAKRRLTLIRFYARHRKELDRANFIGGAKMLVDAIKAHGLLVDDSPRWVEDHYQQRRDEHLCGVEVVIEEIQPQPEGATRP
jgi:hypothetical protein